LERLEPGAKGIFLSSSKGGLHCFQEAHPDLGPYLWRFRSESPGCSLRAELAWTGPGRNTPLACATGAYSIGLAFEEIRAGRLQVALAGSAEASLTPLVVAAFARLGALSMAREPDSYRGPFDRRRDGFVLGEGAGALLLASEECVQTWGLRPQAELLGWACTADAWHLTAPEPEGRQAARAMREALAMGGLTPADVAYVNAHGTGTLVGDEAEFRALRAVFGEAPKLRVSSVKGATGHTLGAAGAIEAAVSVETLREGRLPLCVACVEPMEGMKAWLPSPGEELRPGVVLSLSMGFGGHNVALVFGPWKGKA
jgi:3-oxoacyl-[acyl-carrier-protein] synthase II